MQKNGALTRVSLACRTVRENCFEEMKYLTLLKMFIMKNWAHKENLEGGLLNFLSNFINELEDSGKIYFPDLRDADKIYIFSDYSGDHRDQKLIAYSILILDEKSFKSFMISQKSLWEKYNLEKRIIDYKGLNDNFKKRSLVPFLKLSNNINGLLFSIVFDKKITSIFQDGLPEYLQNQIDIWNNKKVQEKILRLREFIPLLLKGLCKEKQNVLWITDNDNIVANNVQLKLLENMLIEKLNTELDFKIESFNIQTLTIGYEDRYLEKICSLPDLAAGALMLISSFL